MKPSCQIDNKLSIQIQIFHLKVNTTLKVNQNDSSSKFAQNQTSVESKTNTTVKTQQNLLQSQSSSYSDRFTEQMQTPSLELRQEVSE